MPDSPQCPQCRKVGFVRAEHVVKGDVSFTEMYCGVCEHHWIDDHGAAASARPSRSMRPGTIRGSRQRLEIRSALKRLHWLPLGAE